MFSEFRSSGNSKRFRLLGAYVNRIGEHAECTPPPACEAVLAQENIRPVAAGTRHRLIDSQKLPIFPLIWQLTFPHGRGKNFKIPSRMEYLIS